MKTTKKGFTLIELIVVIAIIGVLAAILVPTMLGYVKKSRISGANTAAGSLYKGINTAITELDEEGVDVGGSHLIELDTAGSINTWKVTSGSAAIFDGNIPTTAGTSLTKFDKKVASFFEDVSKLKGAKAAISGGACVAVACSTDSTYTGTQPNGVSTTDTYEKYKPSATNALDHALANAVIISCGGKLDATNSATGIAGAAAKGFTVTHSGADWDAAIDQTTISVT